MSQGGARPSQGRSIPAPTAQVAPAAPVPPTDNESAQPQDSQAMNEVLRQLFNR